MARYLVTGGAGFVGSHLCDELIKEHTVYVLDDLSSGCIENMPQGVHFVKGDICDYDLVQQMMAEVDGCFHLAGIVSIVQCNENLLKSDHINLTGTLNIIESARVLAKTSKPIPIVFASTCAVYGDRQELPHAETAPTNPISIYAALKLCCEYYGRFANELYNIPFTALRLFNVYGTRQRLESVYAGVISAFMNNLLHDKHCKFFGDGRESRDFVYVKDVVNFFIQAMKTSNNSMRVYNVCTGQDTSIQTIADLLSKLLNKEAIIDHLPHKKGDILHSRGNPDLATHELGITAKRNIETGLKEFVDELALLA